METASNHRQPRSAAKAEGGRPPPGPVHWLIEFVGESGSGKSWLARKLTEHLRTASAVSCAVLGPDDLRTDRKGSRGVAMRSRLKDLRRLAGLALDRRFRSLLSERFGARRLPNKASIRYILDMFIKHGRLAERLRRQSRQTLAILDEGFMTSAGYMFNPDPTLTADRQERLLNAIARVTGPDYANLRKLYVVVRCGDLDVLLDRVRRRRQDSVYAHLAREEAKCLHKKAEEMLATIVEFLRRTNQDYVVIENGAKTGDDLECFRRIQEMLEAEIVRSEEVAGPTCTQRPSRNAAEA